MTKMLKDGDDQRIPLGLKEFNRMVAQNAPGDADSKSLDDVLETYSTIVEKNLPHQIHHARDSAMSLYESFKGDLSSHETFADLGADHIHEKTHKHFDLISDTLYKNLTKEFKKSHGIDLEDILSDFSDTKEKHQQAWMIYDQKTGADPRKNEGLSTFMNTFEKSEDITLHQAYSLLNQELANGADRLVSEIKEKAFNYLTTPFEQFEMASHVKSKLPKHVGVKNQVGFHQLDKMSLYQLLDDVKKGKPSPKGGWDAYNVEFKDPASTYKKAA